MHLSYIPQCTIQNREMCTFLFWMLYCWICEGCIMGLLNRSIAPVRVALAHLHVLQFFQSLRGPSPAGWPSTWFNMRRRWPTGAPLWSGQVACEPMLRPWMWMPWQVGSIPRPLGWLFSPRIILSFPPIVWWWWARLRSVGHSRDSLQVAMIHSSQVAMIHSSQVAMIHSSLVAMIHSWSWLPAAKLLRQLFRKETLDVGVFFKIYGRNRSCWTIVIRYKTALT